MSRICHFRTLPNFAGKALFKAKPISSLPFDLLSRTYSSGEKNSSSRSSRSCNLLKFLSGTAASIACLGAYHLMKDGKRGFEEKCVSLSVQSNSSLFLCPLAQKSIINQLFEAVKKGHFETAKVLIEKGNLNVNIFRKKEIFSEKDEYEVLLECYDPNSKEELEKYISFANFVIKKGYLHLNRTIGGKEGACNLITNIYNHRLFEKDIALRQKLIGFFLEKGVDPHYKSRYLGTPLEHACFSGDGEFFIETCKRCNICLGIEEMDDEKAYKLIYSSLLGKNPDSERGIKDLLYLLKEIKRESHKDKFLKDLNKWSFQYTPEEIEKIHKEI